MEFDKTLLKRKVGMPHPPMLISGEAIGIGSASKTLKNAREISCCLRGFEEGYGSRMYEEEICYKKECAQKRNEEKCKKYISRLSLYTIKDALKYNPNLKEPDQFIKESENLMNYSENQEEQMNQCLALLSKFKSFYKGVSFDKFTCQCFNEIDVWIVRLNNIKNQAVDMSISLSKKKYNI